VNALPERSATIMNKNYMQQYIQLSKKSAWQAATGDIESMYALIETIRKASGITSSRAGT
jgi:hypothetical protein